MLHNIEKMTGASVLAVDGEIGRVCNFLFDDRTWTIRYLVVDVRRWLIRHDVLIAVTALDQPDFDKASFRCNLTRDQVRHSPDIDSRMPVSRQQEAAMREFYGWPAYWSNRNSDHFAIPVAMGRTFPVQGESDPHLRSTEALIEYKVFSDYTEMGSLQDFIVDEASWHIGYLDVQTGSWLRQRSVLLPTGWVEEISWATGRIHLSSSGSQMPVSSEAKKSVTQT